MRKLNLFMLILLLVLGAVSTHAQIDPKDSDGDGIPDTRDKCPQEPGPKENNGCPILIIVTDSDGDGIPDADDACPNEAGPRENRGCPPDDDKPVDTDGDGLIDTEDGCPTVAGPRENKGCPPGDVPPTTPDSDGDGLLDTDDACPFVAGSVDNKGCPPDTTTPEPPFTPPALPVDGCYITPRDNFKVNVREQPDMAANVLGYMLPGKVYEAQGYVLLGTEIWFVLTSYEDSLNITGYASRSVLLASNCAEIPGENTTAPDLDVVSPLILCHVTVGFDAPTWASDPEMDSVIYAAFWFESEPGEPLLAGSKAWGTIYRLESIIIPDEDNVFAVAPSQSIYEEALNSGAPNTYNWPTVVGGIISEDVTLYRLTEDTLPGACGPIVSIDDFANVSMGDTPVERMQCGTNGKSTSVQACWCQTSDSECVDQLVDICHGGGAYIEEGPETTACWWEDTVDRDDIPTRLVESRPSDPGVLEMQCGTNGKSTSVQACWCQTSDSECVDQLVDICHGGGAYIEEGPETTACWFENEAAKDLKANRRARLIEFSRSYNPCGDDLGVWWIKAPNPYGDPFEYHDIGQGICENMLETALNQELEVGSSRLIAGRGRGPADPIDDFDCDGNLVPDLIQFPVPDCADPLDLTTGGEMETRDKELASWWAKALDMICGGGGWVMITEIDEDGDEIVTDAACD